VLQRPRMQGIVKQMLDEAQQAQENASGTGESAKGVSAAPDSKEGRYRDASPAPAAPASPGLYRKHELVEYHSATHKDWLPAVVINVDYEGKIVIDLKPNTWLSKDEQATKIRRRSKAQQSSPGYNLAAAAVGVATPLRQRSPSIGAQAGSARGREASPVPFAGGVPARALTPSRMREGSPHRYGAGGNGSRAPSPGLWRGREPSQDRLVRAGGGGSGSRASTPGRLASPRAGVPPAVYSQRRGNPPFDAHMPPGMPRVPGSPSQRYRMSPAAAAGMAIAGI